MNEIDELEKKWNCKIDFPSTEMASDVVTISGPEYQVPKAVDEFLVCASDHRIHDARAYIITGHGPGKPRDHLAWDTAVEGVFQIA